MESSSASIKKEELQNSLLFRGIEPESVLGLLENCPVQDLKAGDVLIRAGEANRALYLLLSGRVRIHLKLTLDPVTVLGPGEIVGELSLIDGQRTSANVVAATACRLLLIDEKTMWSLVESSHEVARNLLFVLSRRLRHGNNLVLTNQQLQREYERYAVIDALTGVYNRRWLDSMLSRQMERCKKTGWGLSLLILDIDEFKVYNDTHRHLAGDRALHTVATTLRNNMRPGEMIVRYGGDEFVVLLPDVDASTAQDVAERVRQAVAEASIISLERSRLPSVTISIGVAEMRPEDTPESFLEAADQALYAAKQTGGNRVEL